MRVGVYIHVPESMPDQAGTSHFLGQNFAKAVVVVAEVAVGVAAAAAALNPKPLHPKPSTDQVSSMS